MRRGKKIFTLLLSVCLIAGVIQLPQKVQAAAGEMVKGKKAGWEIRYKVLKEGGSSGQERSVQVTKVVQNIAASPETIIIPGDEYIYDAWETTRVFAVTSIAADAFTECVGLTGVTTVRIEGGVTLEPGALNGLSEQVKFQTTSIDTKRALLEYGIPEERITYIGVKSKYVSFGDSIAEGYALPGYVDDSNPIVDGCFTKLLHTYLQNNPAFKEAVSENFAVSGSTSEQLLDQIRRGDYDHALKDADIITITIGSNDLLGPFIDIVKEVIGESRILEILKKEHPSIIELKRAADMIPGIIAALNNIPTTEKYNEKLNNACIKFIGTPETPGTQQQILDKITSLAPGAKIYWTTLYNPFYGQTLDLKVLFPALEDHMPDPHALPLGALARPYIEEMNKAFERSDTRYESVDLYDAFNNDDLTNVIISGSLKDGTFNLDPHPNTDGHIVIANILGNAVAASYRPGEPAPDQSGAGDFLTYSLQGVQGTIDQTARTVAVTLPYGTDVTDLAAGFTVSDKAKVYVGDVIQESGVTKNNFAGSVTYTVESEIGTRKEYTVNAAVEGPPQIAADTGDRSPVLWYVMLALASAAAMLLYLRKNDKRKGKRGY